MVEHTGDYLYAPNNTGNAYFPYPGEKSMVILDGATGEVTARMPLKGDGNYEPVTVGPIVATDGNGYLLVTEGPELTLYGLSWDGPVSETVIVAGTCTSNCTGPVPYQLLPDGTGGLLVTASWNVSSQAPVDVRLTRFDGAGGRTDTSISGATIQMIGQSGTAYLRVTSGATTVSQPVMDVLTWTPRWHLPVEWTLLAASPDGGAVAQNAAGDVGRFDGTGQLLETTPAPGLRNPVQELGGWLGNSDYGLRAVAGAFDDATRWDARYSKILWSSPEQYGFGGRQRNQAQRRPGVGIFAKAHEVAGVTGYCHVAIWVAIDRNDPRRACQEFCVWGIT